MTKKKRSVLLAVLTLVLCVALVAAGTYALFSDKVTLGNHLQAGTLDITLIRTKLVTESLDPSTGFIVHKENTERIDFSTPWDPEHPELKNENVFDMVEGLLIAPGCSYSAEMQIINNSDVAFGYWIQIDFDDEADLALANQLKITIETVDSQKSIDGKILSESKGLIGSEKSPIGVLSKTAEGKLQEFTVTVEFADSKANNDAKNAAFDFDLIVHAVQVTTAPKA